MKLAAVSVAVLIGILVSIAFLQYGTLSPCGMLKQKFRAHYLAQVMPELAQLKEAEGLEAVGTVLGYAIGDRMIEAWFASLSPAQCIRGLINWDPQQYTAADSLMQQTKKPNVTTGMGQAVVYFVTPSDLKRQEKISKERFLRVGGMVVQGSLQKDLQNFTYRFQITDGVEMIPVYFRGIPPDLFVEGKGAVVEGRLGEDGVFIASTIMAKHAEEYSPPKSGEGSQTRSFVPGKE